MLSGKRLIILACEACRDSWLTVWKASRCRQRWSVKIRIKYPSIFDAIVTVFENQFDCHFHTLWLPRISDCWLRTFWFLKKELSTVWAKFKVSNIYSSLGIMVRSITNGNAHEIMVIVWRTEFSIFGVIFRVSLELLACNHALIGFPSSVAKAWSSPWWQTRYLSWYSRCFSFSSGSFWEIWEQNPFQASEKWSNSSTALVFIPQYILSLPWLVVQWMVVYFEEPFACRATLEPKKYQESWSSQRPKV